MTDFVLRVKVKDFEFEAHADSAEEVRSLVDDCTEKYLSQYNAWQEKKLKS